MEKAILVSDIVWEEKEKIQNDSTYIHIMRGNFVLEFPHIKNKKSRIKNYEVHIEVVNCLDMMHAKHWNGQFIRVYGDGRKDYRINDWRDLRDGLKDVHSEISSRYDFIEHITCEDSYWTPKFINNDDVIKKINEKAKEMFETFEKESTVMSTKQFHEKFSKKFE